MKTSFSQTYGVQQEELNEATSPSKTSKGTKISPDVVSEISEHSPISKVEDATKSTRTQKTTIKQQEQIRDTDDETFSEEVN